MALGYLFYFLGRVDEFKRLVLPHCGHSVLAYAFRMSFAEPDDDKDDPWTKAYKRWRSIELWGALALVLIALASWAVEAILQGPD